MSFSVLLEFLDAIFSCISTFTAFVHSIQENEDSWLENILCCHSLSYPLCFSCDFSTEFSFTFKKMFLNLHMLLKIINLPVMIKKL